VQIGHVELALGVRTGTGNLVISSQVLIRQSRLCSGGLCLPHRASLFDPSRVGHSSAFRAQQIHAEAQYQYQYALWHENGVGFEMDLINSAKYYKFAADQNDAMAQANYAYCLENGVGVSIDLINAAKYHKLAADQNDAVAQNNYDHCL
jgi:hypothetical protein